MPGFNKKGPEGMGPMTGKGRGFCAQSDDSFVQSLTYGAGRRRGRGPGQNYQSRMPWSAKLRGNGFDRAQEKNLLESRIVSLKEELEAIEKRLNELARTGESDI